MPDQSSAPMPPGSTPRPGLSGDQPAGGRGDPQRAHAVVAVRDRDDAGGDRGRAAPGAAGGRAGGVPRVAGDRAGRVGGRVEAQLRHPGDPDARPRRPRAAGRRPGGPPVAGTGRPAAEPSVTTSPATATLSLTATGTPARGSRDRSGDASTAAASASAASRRTTRKAPIRGLDRRQVVEVGADDLDGRRARPSGPGRRSRWRGDRPAGPGAEPGRPPLASMARTVAAAADTFRGSRG